MTRAHGGVMFAIVALAAACEDSPPRPNPGNPPADAGVLADGSGADVVAIDAADRDAANMDAAEMDAESDAGAPMDASVARWEQVATGVEHSCALASDGHLECWGANGDGQLDAPAGTFTALDATYGDYSCAIATDRTVTCWGETLYFADGFPSSALAAISTGWHHACGLASIPGNARCWGLASLVATAPATEFSALSAGQDFGCGIRASDATIECWGLFDVGAPPDPTATFEQVSSGTLHACGIVTGGEVVCWGDLTDMPSPPPGPFVQVEAANRFNCGIRSDQTLVCWGDDIFTDGLLTPPSGSFSSVSTGFWHACAIRTDGSLACWGTNSEGQATPPS